MRYKTRLQRQITMYITALLLAMFSFVLVNVAYGWFVITLNEDTFLDFGSGDAVAVIDFGRVRAGTNADGSHNYNGLRDAVLTDGEIVFSFDLDISDVNLWPQTRIRIAYAGTGASYMRVCLVEEWTDKTTGKGLRLPRGDYSIRNDLWIDKSVEQQYYYYCNSAAAAGTDMYEVYNPSGSSGPLYIEFVYSGPPVSLPRQYDNRSLRLKVLVETAQSNRALTLWGIDSMPTR